MVETEHVLIVGVIAYLLAMGAFFGPLDGPPQPGEVGTAHAHLYFAVSLEGERIDFSQERYQLADRRVHFENQDGEILHVHAEDVTVRYTLRTLGIGINGTCITSGEVRCANSTHDLRVYVDGEVLEDPLSYVPRQDDNVMVWYGPEDEGPDDGFFQRVLPDRFRPGRSGESI